MGVPPRLLTDGRIDILYKKLSRKKTSMRKINLKHLTFYEQKEMRGQAHTWSGGWIGSVKQRLGSQRL